MINVEIEIFVKEDGICKVEDESKRSEVVSAGMDIVLNRMLKITNIFSELRKEATWYLTGKSKKEAMEKVVISNGAISEKGNALICQNVMSDFPLIVAQTWNSYDDLILCQNYIQSDLCNFSYSLDFSFDNEAQMSSLMSQLINNIINNISPVTFRVETNSYSLLQNNVFPDRLPVGWIFYTNKVHNKKLSGLKGNMHIITKDDEPIGTLFLSKKGFFDGSNKEDIKAANDLEIMLVSHDILPTYRNIF